jgi:hypothetical protein
MSSPLSGSIGLLEVWGIEQVRCAARSHVARPFITYSTAQLQSINQIRATIVGLLICYDTCDRRPGQLTLDRAIHRYLPPHRVFQALTA